MSSLRIVRGCDDVTIEIIFAAVRLLLGKEFATSDGTPLVGPCIIKTIGRRCEGNGILAERREIRHSSTHEVVQTQEGMFVLDRWPKFALEHVARKSGA